MAIEATREAVDVPTPHRFTVDDYYRMAEIGVLGPTDRVQLVDGVMYDMPPIGPDHAEGVTDLTLRFIDRFRHGAVVRAQQPVRLGIRSEPEPDLVLARMWPGVKRPYRRAHPTPDDVLLIVEVAKSSLDFDLKTKATDFAQHGIQDYWVLDIDGDRLIVLRDPADGQYRRRRELRRGETISPLAFQDVTLTVDEILGEPE
jgi:Uma2 family endonuclease